MMTSMILYLEDMVGYELPMDALTILLLVHVVRHTDLLSEGEKKHSLYLFYGQICNSCIAARSVVMF